MSPDREASSLYRFVKTELDAFELNEAHLHAALARGSSRASSSSLPSPPPSASYQQSDPLVGSQTLSLVKNLENKKEEGPLESDMDRRGSLSSSNDSSFEEEEVVAGSQSGPPHNGLPFLRFLLGLKHLSPVATLVRGMHGGLSRQPALLLFLASVSGHIILAAWVYISPYSRGIPGRNSYLANPTGAEAVGGAFVIGFCISLLAPFLDYICQALLSTASSAMIRYQFPILTGELSRRRAFEEVLVDVPTSAIEERLKMGPGLDIASDAAAAASAEQLNSAAASASMSSVASPPEGGSGESKGVVGLANNNTIIVAEEAAFSLYKAPAWMSWINAWRLFTGAPWVRQPVVYTASAAAVAAGGGEEENFSPPPPWERALREALRQVDESIVTSLSGPCGACGRGIIIHQHSSLQGSSSPPPTAPLLFFSPAHIQAFLLHAFVYTVYTIVWGYIFVCFMAFTLFTLGKGEAAACMVLLASAAGLAVKNLLVLPGVAALRNFILWETPSPGTLPSSTVAGSIFIPASPYHSVSPGSMVKESDNYENTPQVDDFGALAAPLYTLGVLTSRMTSMSLPNALSASSRIPLDHGYVLYGGGWGWLGWVDEPNQPPHQSPLQANRSKALLHLYLILRLGGWQEALLELKSLAAARHEEALTTAENNSTSGFDALLKNLTNTTPIRQLMMPREGGGSSIIGNPSPHHSHRSPTALQLRGGRAAILSPAQAAAASRLGKSPSALLNGKMGSGSWLASSSSTTLSSRLSSRDRESNLNTSSSSVDPPGSEDMRTISSTQGSHPTLLNGRSSSASEASAAIASLQARWRTVNVARFFSPAGSTRSTTGVSNLSRTPSRGLALNGAAQLRQIGTLRQAGSGLLHNKGL